eukprot:9351519-Pyramimonas_sp.AAC.1
MPPFGEHGSETAGLHGPPPKDHLPLYFETPCWKGGDEGLAAAPPLVWAENAMMGAVRWGEGRAEFLETVKGLEQVIVTAGQQHFSKTTAPTSTYSEDCRRRREHLRQRAHRRHSKLGNTPGYARTADQELKDLTKELTRARRFQTRIRRARLVQEAKDALRSGR